MAVHFGGRQVELSEFEARLLVVTSSRPGTLTLFQKKTKFKKNNNKMKFSHKEKKKNTRKQRRKSTRKKVLKKETKVKKKWEQGHKPWGGKSPQTNERDESGRHSHSADYPEISRPWRQT